jgi:hypothetical protein
MYEYNDFGILTTQSFVTIGSLVCRGPVIGGASDNYYHWLIVYSHK